MIFEKIECLSLKQSPYVYNMKIYIIHIIDIEIAIGTC
jgi:hypothetical protein